jgi:CTP synthase
VDQSNRDKIALFTNLPSQHVLSIPDVPNIYHVPLVMMQQGLHEMLASRLGLGAGAGAAAEAEAEGETTKRIHGNAFYQQWRDMALGIDDHNNAQATVALVGKYCTQQDAYLSVISALRHACIGTGQRLNLVMVEASHLEEGGEHGPAAHEAAWTAVRSADAVLVPGGFGIRGIEGKVAAVRYARESRVPFLGVCLGMQAAVIEYTRSVLLRPGASSREFAPDCSEDDAAVIFMPEGDREVFGGTMRLGARRTTLAPGSLAAALYGDASSVLERHRHRYEVNPSLVSLLEARGLRFSGKDDSKERMEVVELPRDVHPYFVGTQYHPEFKSRPLRPAPVFLGLLQAAKEARNERQQALAAFKTSNLQQA